MLLVTLDAIAILIWPVQKFTLKKSLAWNTFAKYAENDSRQRNLSCATYAVTSNENESVLSK